MIQGGAEKPGGAYRAMNASPKRPCVFRPAETGSGIAGTIIGYQQLAVERNPTNRAALRVSLG
jgi:hypothetical protein